MLFASARIWQSIRVGGTPYLPTENHPQDSTLFSQVLLPLSCWVPPTAFEFGQWQDCHQALSMWIVRNLNFKNRLVVTIPTNSMRADLLPQTLLSPRIRIIQRLCLQSLTLPSKGNHNSIPSPLWSDSGQTCIDEKVHQSSGREADEAKLEQEVGCRHTYSRDIECEYWMLSSYSSFSTSQSIVKEYHYSLHLPKFRRVLHYTFWCFSISMSLLPFTYRLLVIWGERGKRS